MQEYLNSFSILPIWFWVGLSFIYGSIIGSFLNVCIHRIPRNEEIVKTPSHCFNCGEQIKWFYNIPIVGWLILKGKTACCSEPLPLRYFLVEILSATTTAYLAWSLGFSWSFFHGWIFCSMMIVLIFTDWEHMRLPNIITLPGVAIGLIFALFSVQIDITNALTGAAIGAGSFYLIAWFYEKVRKMEGLGMGDVKLMAMTGAFLGWEAVLLVTVIGSFSALVYGISKMLLTGQDATLKIPFGSFLASAAILSLIWGHFVIDWYAGLLI